MCQRAEWGLLLAKPTWVNTGRLTSACSAPPPKTLGKVCQQPPLLDSTCWGLAALGEDCGDAWGQLQLPQ